VIVLMRLYPKNDATPVWDFVKGKMLSREVRKIQPILASIQEDGGWVTLYLMSDDLEAVGDFIVKDLSECHNILYTMTVPLLKMVFMPVPKDLPSGAKRYSIMLRCDLRHYYSAFKKVMPSCWASTISCSPWWRNPGRSWTRSWRRNSRPSRA